MTEGFFGTLTQILNFFLEIDRFINAGDRSAENCAFSINNDNVWVAEFDVTACGSTVTHTTSSIIFRASFENDPGNDIFVRSSVNEGINNFKFENLL